MSRATDTHSEYVILLSEATMVTRTRLIFTSFRTLPVLFVLEITHTAILRRFEFERIAVLPVLLTTFRSL